MDATQNLKTSGPQHLKVTLPVEGMTCAACQANVQRALTEAPGVAKAAVNLMTHEATVHYNPAATDPAKLVAAINDTGYVSRLPVADAPAGADDQQEQSQAHEYRTLLRKALPAFAKTVVEFTATAGRHEFSCGMGMLHGAIVGK